jgi:hypothetical protein
MEEALLQLLTTLEALGETHEELYDSEVRERMGNAIRDGYVREKPNYEVPSDLGMYSDEANEAVQRAIETYIAAANELARELGIVTFHDRIAAFQNGNVRVNPETAIDYEELFGHSPPEWYDSEGNVLWDRVR